VILPRAVMEHTQQNEWTLRPADKASYVFCHGDMSQHNVIVDARAPHKIRAVVDWEQSGFYPPWFEVPVYTRIGPNQVSNVHDEAMAKRMLNFLHSQEENAGLSPSFSCSFSCPCSSSSL
jgi:aminoglycoside phosphotransferase (APT) family kinase protein